MPAVRRFRSFVEGRRRRSPVSATALASRYLGERRMPSWGTASSPSHSSISASSVQRRRIRCATRRVRERTLRKDCDRARVDARPPTLSQRHHSRRNVPCLCSTTTRDSARRQIHARLRARVWLRCKITRSPDTQCRSFAPGTLCSASAARIRELVRSHTRPRLLWRRESRLFPTQ